MQENNLNELFGAGIEEQEGKLILEDNAQIGVIGGGPAGSFFSYFLLKLAQKLDLKLNIDIIEPHDFAVAGPAGCNHCGGIVSESLVQILATEGINIPGNVVQKGITSYMLHTSLGSVRIETPYMEKRIAAMFRGAGPRGSNNINLNSFDGFLQKLVIGSGACHVMDRVTGIEYKDGYPIVSIKGGQSKKYDLVVGAVGVNSPALRFFRDLEMGYSPPGLTKTFICEFHLGEALIEQYFGDSMHVFLLNIPRLRFAALIPKGEYVTLAVLGDSLNKEFVDNFLNSAEVRKCFPPDLDLSTAYPCLCFPKINMGISVKPFGNRLVLVGDCAVSRLYKDGIGAAYVSAKTAANIVLLHGVSAADFEKHYWPVCKSIDSDNSFGKIIFAFTRLIQKWNFTKRGILFMVTREQGSGKSTKPLSTVLWDTFTGSAPYREIFLRMLKPSFVSVLSWHATLGIFSRNGLRKQKEKINAFRSTR